MKSKLAFVLGAGVGYVLGTRAGRQQFEKIKGFASDLWSDPRVQGYVQDVEGQAKDFARQQGSALKDKAVDAAKSAFSSSSSSGGSGTSSASSALDDDIPVSPITDPDGPPQTRP
ncbi:YtxH domain-containing protein [Cellulomonas massiliensis]|uniref:YtxH domain-containing protein n=1 Tax=Cellulomonas massiliensis TaxID=1465811 RepID=UPI0002F84EFD|nr:YtxH domain-containing protein [Cellulomonas massiliensis]